MLWARGSRKLRNELLTLPGLQLLHAKMFGAVWTWAGLIGTRGTNLGIETHRIREELLQLCGDVAYQIEHGTYPWAELAVRFHHRLVWIHPFVNGNGRHARLAADLLLEFHDRAPLPWGGPAPLGKASTNRDRYLAALRAADRGEYDDLVAFATRER